MDLTMNPLIKGSATSLAGQPLYSWMEGKRESSKLQCNELRRKYYHVIYFDHHVLTEQTHVDNYISKWPVFPNPVSRQPKTSFTLKKDFKISLCCSFNSRNQLLHLLFRPFLTACFFPGL